MLIDAHNIQPESTIETDICIVGAGVAGISFAREFLNGKHRICLIESGGVKADRETQSLYWGKNIGLPYYELDKSRARYLGGTSHFWHIPIGKNQLGVRLRGLDPIDFEERDWVPYSGWPFGISHLEPYYRKAHEVCRIGAISDRPEDWTDPNEPDHTYFSSRRLDTTVFQFGNREIFFKDYVSEIEQSENISIFTYANCVNIATDENAGKVERLDIRCLNGPEFKVKAKVYILATGGIEVPRMLLLSNRIQKNGLGNENDLVGRFFMEHPHLWSGTYIPADLSIAHRTDFYKIRRVGDVPIMGKLTIKEATLRKERLLNYTVSIHPDYKASKAYYKSRLSEGYHSAKEMRSAIGKRRFPRHFHKHAINIIKSFPSLSVELYRHLTNHFHKGYTAGEQLIVYRLNHMAEQVPNPESRVLLDDEKDALGLNRVKLRWRLTSQDIQSMIRAQEIIDEELKKLGLGSLNIEMEGTEPPASLHGGWHHMGTTRMHIDSKKGVVNEHCRLHGISNLYIAGASVFPTGGYANPVLTTIALVIRLADHIKKNLESQPRITAVGV